MSLSVRRPPLRDHGEAPSSSPSRSQPPSCLAPWLHGPPRAPADGIATVLSCRNGWRDPMRSADVAKRWCRSATLRRLPTA